MKQSIRVTLFGTLILALAVIGVGGTSLYLSFTDALSANAKVLQQGVDNITEAGASLSAAIAYSENAELPIAVGLVAFDKSVTTVHDTDFQFESAYSPGLLKSAGKHALVIEASTPYQLRAIKTPGNEYVLIGTSIVTIRAGLDRGVLSLAVASLVAIALGGAAVFLLNRRNMRLVISALSNSAEHERETRKSMQTFMGDASHELRTPLTVIKGYSELLAKDGGVDAEQRARAYDRIVEQVNRMDDTIASLLELAEVGSVSANEFVPVDLAELVSGAADDLRAMSPTREIAVHVEPATVNGSKDLLGKLLANAIGNIARHAGQKAEVSISLKAGKKAAQLVIEDGGRGLPEQAYARGIQAFQRFDQSRSRDTGGTGLGMSIMNSIVQSHGGNLTISKSKLGGLKLDIQLPLN